MNLHDLNERRRKRVRKRKRHYRKYVAARAKKQPRRRDYHLSLFRQQIEAIEKIDRLIAAEEGLIRERRIDWRGKAPLTHAPLLKAVRVALTVSGLYVTSTNGGTHSTTSWHYQNRAVDFGSNDPSEAPEKKAQELLLKRFGAHYFAELFGPCDWYVKNGVKSSGTFPAHGDHLHVAVA